MKIHSLQLALSICISFGMLAGCGPGPNDPMSAKPPIQSASKQSLNLRAQAALASFHEIDGSFSDTLRLAKAQGFRIKLLGGVLDDDDDSGASASGSAGVDLSTDVSASVDDNDIDASAGASVDASASADTSGGGGSSSASLGASADTSVSAGTADSSLGASAGVDADASASLDSSDASAGVNAGASADASASLDGSDAGASLSTGVNADAGASLNGSDAGANLSTGVNADASAGLNGSAGSGDLSASLGVDATLDAMADAANDFSSQISAGGNVDLAADGSFNVDDQGLNTDVLDDLTNDADLSSLEDLDLDQLKGKLSDVSDNLLSRLSDQDFNVLAGNLGSETNADGSVTTTFGAHFDGLGSSRNVALSSQIQGNSQLELDFALEETGSGFVRNALRKVDFNADGSAHVSTEVTVKFDGGGELKILEDRFLDINGNGVGHGTLELTSSTGASIESGELRTMVNADGSLTSNLDLDTGSDLVLSESASGEANLAVTGGVDSKWTKVDISAMANTQLKADVQS
ncbi:MAG TPA: hypothetical protein V6D23_01595 [Candidatus Obscuribacterales bacterium]